MKTKKKQAFLSMIAVIMSLFAHAQIHHYAVAPSPWKEDFGNHRAVLNVTKREDAVYVKLYWRRRDREPQQKCLIITDANGKQVTNIYRININREFGEIIFQPFSIGIYYLYYMPFTGEKNNGYWNGKYLTPEQNPEVSWLQKNKIENTRPSLFAAADVMQIESRTAFDSFYPMEICATEQETRSISNSTAVNFMLFPEDRTYPIRMKESLPYRWVSNGSSSIFRGNAMRNEYYTFQIGLFAKKNLTDVSVTFNKTDKATCFNCEGIDADGKSFAKKLNVTKGNVQALWIGVDVPEYEKPGKMVFEVVISVANEKPQTVKVILNISDKILTDRGDSELWRHSRLRWLNSTLGSDKEPTAPYTDLKLAGRSIKYKMGKLELNDQGMIDAVSIRNTVLISTPVSFIVETNAGVEHVSSSMKFTEIHSGQINWEAKSVASDYLIKTHGYMEFDGSISYNIKVIAQKDFVAKNIRLSIPVEKKQAQYFMGMGLPGKYCPSTYDWKWNGPQDSYWIGSVNAGLHCELQGASYSGPLLNLYHPAPPVSWYNNNKGGFTITSSSDLTIASAFSGEHRFNSGDTINFSFRIILTPVKELNTADQFVNRYYHNGSKPSPELSDLDYGIKITNVHHANPINPYINYPFIALDSMKQFVNFWQRKGLKVKIYYTIRELTNQVPELWALRSLGNEIIADGNGGGYPWLQEHLVSNYDVQWFTQINGYEKCDAAVRTSGKSRWYNYYINGLQWLVKNVGIDGIYLDDVAFDRNMLKRMRKVMDAAKQGCIIDLHSNTGFSRGPANQYTEFFPYINKLWFGESFQYNNMSPDNWLVEVSGIPFGLMGDMLHAGGNPWRGMIYGMTVRYPWYTEGVNCDPRDIWKVWDMFEIDKAKMIGYWDSSCPVKTTDENILATAYVNKNKTLVSIASWAKETKDVRLLVDWKALNLDPDKVKLRMPGIKNFQEEMFLKADGKITIEPTKGVLILIE